MSSGLEETLTHGKIGGVPVWGVGVGVAAVFILVMHMRSQVPKSGSNSGQQSDGTFDPNAIDPNTGLPYADEQPAGYGLPPGPIGDWLSQNPTGSQYPVGLPGQGIPSPITNQQWARQVENGLLAKGDDPTLVSNALSKYLNGTTLTQAEQAVISLALQMFGAPPEGVLPIPVDKPPSPTPTPTPSPVPPPSPSPVPKPVPAPAPKPVRYATVTVWPMAGSSLWSIAEKFYGNGNRYMDIYNANRKGITRADGTPGILTSPRVVFPGQRLIVP